jgi:phage gpG-like protein
VALTPRLELTPIGFDVTARRFRHMAERLDDGEMMITNELVIKTIEEYHAKTWGRQTLPVTEGTKRRWPGRKGQLDLTGRLRASMTDSGAPGAIRQNLPSHVVYGTSIYYGKFVNDGTSKMPARPFVRFNTPLKQAIKNVYAERLIGRDAGLAGRI